MNPKLNLLFARRSVRAYRGDHEIPPGLVGDLLEAAMENLLLAASALGLGACWLGVHPREERLLHLRQLLSIPETIVPVGVAALGWPAEERPARTRFQAAHVHEDTW